MRTLRYGTNDAQYVEIWDPTDEPIGAAVLIHGGYWRDRYSLDLMDPMAEHLAARGWRVFNIEYRRLGDERGIWPQMSDDVLAAVALAEPGPVAVIGHSAGGHLALWAAANTSNVDVVIALAPVADLEEADRRDLSDGVVRQLLDGARDTVPDRYRSASPHALVPLGVAQLIVHGRADDNVPIDIATGYAARAEQAGDDVEMLTPDGIDHFHVIDPGHEIWRMIDDRLDRVARPGA